MPKKLTLPASKGQDIALSYRPLVEAESQGEVVLQCPQLGTFKYSLDLKGLPTAPEKQMNFNVVLGQFETRVCRVQHFAVDKTEFTCTFKTSGNVFSNLGFLCPAKVVAEPALE